MADKSTQGNARGRELVRLGLEATDYTLGVMTIGASNRRPDPSSVAWACFVNMREARARSGFDRLTVLDQIRSMSSDAHVAGCGNCGEHAAVAFMYLYNRGVRPIEYVIESPDHAFVVVGGRPNDPRSGIVVDAYYARVYGGHRWRVAPTQSARFE